MLFEDQIYSLSFLPFWLYLFPHSGKEKKKIVFSAYAKCHTLYEDLQVRTGCVALELTEMDKINQQVQWRGLQVSAKEKVTPFMAGSPQAVW